MNNDKYLLELKGIAFGYDDKILLENVNLKVGPTDFIGIIGANGGGKTTLLRLILGLVKPLSGEISYRFKQPLSKSVGYMPQKNHFDEKFPIIVQEVILSGLLSQVGLFSKFRGKEKKRLGQIMGQMGIEQLAQRTVGELSGGELQRVLLARALVGEPELLILDEPSTFVDKGFKKDFYDILQDLNQHIAIMLVSHDLGMISSYVKTIGCVNQGLHYHYSNVISQEVLDTYNCPIDLITHGELPHRVLENHPSPGGKGSKNA